MNKYILFFLTLLLFICCSDNEQDLEVNIRVEVFYKSDYLSGEYNSDIGAKIFLYYEKDSYDFFHSAYEGDGIFVKKNDSIIPDQSVSIDSIGFVFVKPEHTDRMFTLIIESHYYSPELMHFVFPSVKRMLPVTAIFESYSEK